jgi:hypothetical protein
MNKIPIGKICLNKEMSLTFYEILRVPEADPPASGTALNDGHDQIVIQKESRVFGTTEESFDCLQLVQIIIVHNS